MDMDAFVKKEQGQRTDIYRATGETWLNDLSSFMDREMAEKKNWWKNRRGVHGSSPVLVTVSEVGAETLTGREEEVSQPGCTHVRMDVCCVRPVTCCSSSPRLRQDNKGLSYVFATMKIRTAEREKKNDVALRRAGIPRHRRSVSTNICAERTW